MAQIIAAYLYVKYDKNEFIQNNLKNLIVNSQIISNNSTAAIIFDDAKQATDILKSLKAEKSVKFACIYNNQKKTFAYYKRDSSILTYRTLFFNSNKNTEITDNSITILRPIYDETDNLYL